MPLSGTFEQNLDELRRITRGSQRRVSRLPEAAPLLARMLGGCRTMAIERRAGGIAIHLRAADEAAGECILTCVIRDLEDTVRLARAERAVAGLLCDGRTLAQIATLRGVTVNTVKSQVRQIFRKLDVDTRVALVRRLCP